MELDPLDPTPIATTPRERVVAGLLAGLIGVGIATGCGMPVAPVRPRITNATAEDVVVMLEAPSSSQVERAEATLPPGGTMIARPITVQRRYLDRVQITAWLPARPEQRSRSGVPRDDASFEIVNVDGQLVIRLIPVESEVAR